MQNKFPKLKAAAVQAAPVYLDLDATTDKVCGFIRTAAENGADIVVFPEAFIPGYPHWVWLDCPGNPDRFFAQLVKNSVAVPSLTTQKLCRVAREAEIYVAVGINETSPHSIGEIFNTSLLIQSDGQIIGKHRKIIPTYAEKLVWSFGDGSSLRVYDTQLGKIGMLNCGENTNSLARYALIAQSEQLHISTYPAFPQKGRYDLKRAIEIRAAAHSFEGKVFNIVASSLISDDMKRLLGDTPEKMEMLNGTGGAFTGIIGPDGAVLGGPLPDGEEGIVYANIDLEKSLNWKLFHDIAGNYNRFDILSLNVNRQTRRPIVFEPQTAEVSSLFKSEQIKELIDKCNEIQSDTLRSELLGIVESLPKPLA